MASIEDGGGGFSHSRPSLARITADRKYVARPLPLLDGSISLIFQPRWPERKRRLRKQEELNRLAQQGWELSDVIALAAAMRLPGIRGPVEAVAFLKRSVAA